MAVCLLESANGETGSNDTEAKKKEWREEAIKLMARVPTLRQKIAGKSIPLEVRITVHLIRPNIHPDKILHLLQKLVARKARKFHSQNNHLALPALELAYLFLAIAHAPRTVIVVKMLPQIDDLLTQLSQSKNDMSGYIGGRDSYWDDYCLGMFLKGVCMRYIAYPVSFQGLFWVLVCCCCCGGTDSSFIRIRKLNSILKNQLLFHKTKRLELLKSHLEMFLNMDRILN